MTTSNELNVVCAVCGLENAPNATSCDRCATVFDRYVQKCPYCAEQIKIGAIVCRFCKLNLQTGLPIAVPSVPRPQAVRAKSGVMDGVKLGFGMFIVLPLIVAVVVFIFLVLVFGPRTALRILLEK